MYIIFLFLTLFAFTWSLDQVPADDDVGLGMVEIVTKRGYTIETHYVTTRDGYILTMFRIPSTSRSGGAPVLLQHGLLDSSWTWVANFDKESLGFILANKGFDVWFGNNRGNRYGRNHTTLNPDDGSEAFWQFSWDEMALSDLPSMIHYVLDTTQHTSLGYVGHSEGTIQMFAAASSLEAENDAYLTSAIQAVNIFVALAPVAYVSNQRSKVIQLLAESDVLDKIYARGVYEFLPYGPINEVAPEICQQIEKGCDAFLFAICGPTRHTNTSRIQVYVSNTPAGTSTQNMFHWLQGVMTPTFQKYDFGSADANVAKYGVSEPPLYDLGRLAVPTALFYGQHDYLADSDDVARLMSEVPVDKVVLTDFQDDFAHLDYTWAYDANVRIYGTVSSLLTQYKK